VFISKPDQCIALLEGILPSIFAGMILHQHHVKVIRSCLALFRLLTIDSTPTRKMVLHDKLEVISTFMRQFPHDESIQMDSCAIFGNVCQSEEAQRVLSRSSCIDSVLQSQLNNKGSNKVQTLALWFHSRILDHSYTEAADSAFGCHRGPRELTSLVNLLSPSPAMPLST
jgi:hypothetical protein